MKSCYVFVCRSAAAAIREFEDILDERYPKATQWDMVTLPREEVEIMRDIIKHQDKKIREVTERFLN